MNAMKTELSPAAHAVYKAYYSTDDDLAGPAIAAALRETVNQLKFFGITEKNILAIATELETQS
jgi:nicotinic acid phosphoribosyltransferase